MHAYMLSRSVASNSLWPQGLCLLCTWDYPGKNTGVGCHFFLQEIFLTQVSNTCLLCLLHWQADSLPLNMRIIASLCCKLEFAKRPNLKSTHTHSHTHIHTYIMVTMLRWWLMYLVFGAFHNVYLFQSIKLYTLSIYNFYISKLSQ